jgi:hypothetical protein
MMHNDVIKLGNHSIKFEYPVATAARQVDATDMADTVIMKNLDDMRRMLAQENTHEMLLDIDELMSMGDSDR